MCLYYYICFIIKKRKERNVSTRRTRGPTRWSDKSATRCYASRFVSASNLAQWHLINGHHLHTDSSWRRPQLNYLVNSAKAIVRQRNRIYPPKSSLKRINSAITLISMRINYLPLLLCSNSAFKITMSFHNTISSGAASTVINPCFRGIILPRARTSRQIENE